MNILLATGIYPPESGGPATYTHDLAQALVARGHGVTVVTYGEGDREDHASRITRQGFDVIRVSRRGGIVARYARYTWTVYRLARKVDVIFAQGAVSEGAPATIIAKLLGRKLVMRIPGDYAWEMGMQIASKDTEDSLDRFLMRRHTNRVGVYEWLERWTSRSARRVIAPSQYIRSVVLRWGVFQDRIEVIKNAVQPLPDTEGRASLRQQFHLEKHVVCFTAVRALPWKGVADLISWWHRLPAAHLLVVAGDGPELETWKTLAIHEGVQDRVRFLGRIDRQAMAKWYDAADVFVLHTGYEGYPHTVPEAVSRGLPCLVSDQGGNPETKEEFGDQVTVVPYQDRDAWVAALSAVEPRALSATVVPSVWMHDQMVEAVEHVLRAAVDPASDKRMHVCMLGYERELLKTESAAFARVSSLATSYTSLSAIVLARVPEDVELERDGLHVRAFAGRSFHRVYQAIRAGIRDARRLPGRTIISAQDPFAAGWIGYVISRFTNQPLEVQEHGDFWSGEWVKERIIHRVWSVAGLILLRRVERVRVVSERVKEHLIARGISSEKIEVIPVAQDIEDLFAHSVASLKDGQSFTFVAPCRFVAQKGLNVLLEAFALLRARGVDARLVLAGSGPLELWLRATIDAKQLTTHVDIRGWMSSQNLWEDVHGLVLSSRYEGWGRTIVEAMAAGVSVVTTDVGCVGSFFRPDVDGLMVPVGDAEALSKAMENMISDTSSRERMCNAARERARTLMPREALHEAQRGGWSKMLQETSAEKEGTRFELWVWAFVIFSITSRGLSVILFHNQLLNREWGFYILVDRWLHGYGYSFAAQLGCASAYRSPGFLFFLTGLYKVFDPSNTWAQATVQNIVVVGALWLTYVVGKRFVGSRAALVGAFLMACYPYTFYHYTQYYHTFLQAFFLLLVMWCVLRLDETRRVKYAFASGLAIGALAYVQGTILAATPFIALWIMWRFWPNWKRAVLFVAIIAVCSAGLIAPWTYRSWKIFHHFVPLTTDVGLALFKANNENIGVLTALGYPQETVGEPTTSSTNPFYLQYRLPAELEASLTKQGLLRPSIFWTEWHPREPTGRVDTCTALGPLNEYEYNQYWNTKANDWIRANWRTEGWKLQLQKVSTFWRPGLFPFIKTGAPWSFAGSPLKEWLARMSVAVSMFVVIVFGWIGVLCALRRREKTVWLPLTLFLVFTFLHSMLAGYTKYRIPLDHLMVAYAGWSLIQIWDWLRGRSFPF